MGGPGMQWTFSNKVSALPPSITMNMSQEEHSKKLTFEHHSSSGFQPITTTFDCSQKPVYSPAQPSGTTSMNMLSEGFYHFGSPIGQEVCDKVDAFKLADGGQSLCMNISKSEAAPPQLTIFYKGMVNVYDNISPEKAQAIMFLAGSRSSMASVSIHPRTALMQAVAPKHTVADGMHGSQSRVASPCSGLSSQISVGSRPSGQPGGRACKTDNLMVTNTSALLVDSTNQSEPPKIEKHVGSAVATLVPSEVPQARKASLARFLEKRKERVVNNGPYSLPTSSTENACGSNISSFVSKPQTAPATQSSSNDQQFCRALHKNDPMNLQAKSEM
ncbi:hypothetical protein ACLOJK_023731 [Asimina triloba]